MFLLKLSIRPFRISPWMQLLCAISTALILFLTGVLYWFQIGVTQIVQKINNDSVVLVYLDSSLNPKQRKVVEDQIRTEMSSASRPINVTGFSSQDFLENIELSYPSLREELVGLAEDFTQVVPHYIVANGRLNQNEIGQIAKMKGVETVESSKHRYQSIVEAFKAIRWVMLALSVGLSIALVTMIFQMSRINDVINEKIGPLMKLWGASELEIRMPGFNATVIMGLLGGVVAAIFYLLFYHHLTDRIQVLIPFLSDVQMPKLNLATTMIIAGLCVGVLAGVASALRTRKRLI